MTRKEAIKIIEVVFQSKEAYKHNDSVTHQALNMAIEALSADAEQGEWGHMIADGADGSHWYEYECSHCGEVVLRPYNYCPNCGTRMVREEKSNEDNGFE